MFMVNAVTKYLRGSSFVIGRIKQYSKMETISAYLKVAELLLENLSILDLELTMRIAILLSWNTLQKGLQSPLVGTFSPKESFSVIPELQPPFRVAWLAKISHKMLQLPFKEFYTCLDNLLILQMS